MRIANTAETFNPKCTNGRGLGHGLWTPARSLHDDETNTTRAFQARVRACERVLREGLTRTTSPRVGHTL